MGGSQAEVIDKRRVVPDLSSVPAPMRPLLQAMLQPRPEDRPPSMAAVANWSAETAAARPASGRGAKPSPTARPPGSSGGRIAAIAGVLILVGGIGGTAYFLRDDLAKLIAPGGVTSGKADAETPTPTQAPTPALPTPAASSAETAVPTSPTPSEAATALPPLPTPSASEGGPPPLPTPSPSEAQATPNATPTAAPTAELGASPEPSPAMTVAHVPTGTELADQLPPKPDVASVVLPPGVVGKAYRAALPNFSDPGGKGLQFSLEPAAPTGPGAEGSRGRAQRNLRRADQSGVERICRRRKKPQWPHRTSAGVGGDRGLGRRAVDADRHAKPHRPKSGGDPDAEAAGNAHSAAPRQAWPRRPSPRRRQSRRHRPPCLRTTRSPGPPSSSPASMAGPAS